MEDPELPLPSLLKQEHDKEDGFDSEPTSSNETITSNLLSLESDFDVRSDEVQEIIGSTPHWLIQSGISALFLVLVIIIITASSIEYPDVINSQLVFTAVNAPKSVEAKVNGKVVRLFVENNSTVAEGDVLGWIESAADHNAVDLLSKQLDSLEYWATNNNYNDIKTAQILNINQLGELQNNVQAFSQAYQAYILHLPGEYYDQKINILNQEREFTDSLLNRLQIQKDIQEADYEISRREYEAQKILAEKDLISELEFLRIEGDLSNKRLPLQQSESAIINNYMAQVSKEKELIEIEKLNNEAQSQFNQSLFSLRSSITEWKQNFMIIAPVSGLLVYSGVVQEQQTFKPGEEVFFIEPKNTGFFGEMNITQESYGKIKIGQTVLVRFSGYPYHEFGLVEGKIEYLSNFPLEDGMFFATVNFPDGLTTNYGQNFAPVNGMKGNAEIITEDMNLLSRIYNNLTKDLR